VSALRQTLAQSESDTVRQWTTDGEVLEVVDITVQQVTASAEKIGYVDRLPATVRRARGMLL